MITEELITEAVLGVFGSVDLNKYNIALGFFQNYSTSVESDTDGVRFCDIKLHYKNGDKDIGLRNIPLMYIGNSNVIFDFELSLNDPVIVLWSDRSLEQWKNTKGPQKLSSSVKDSFNHGMAIPICTVHEVSNVKGYIKTSGTDMDIHMDGTTINITSSGVNIT